MTRKRPESEVGSGSNCPGREGLGIAKQRGGRERPRLEREEGDTKKGCSNGDPARAAIGRPQGTNGTKKPDNPLERRGER